MIASGWRCCVVVVALAAGLVGGDVVLAQNGPAAAASASEPPERSQDDFLYIDNGKIRMGFKRSSGVGIASFETVADGQNVINHWDRGRLVQQSYYGNVDGSTWTLDGKVIPWRWNPVQGGDCRHNSPVVLDVKAGKDQLYSKTVGKNWGGGQDLHEATLEQWVRLEDDVAHVKFRLTYTGSVKHTTHSQELPAVFVEPHYNTLVLYDGADPWTSAPVSKSSPGWPNESRRMTENWAAYIGPDGKGVGVYVPVASELTCYRFGSGEYRREDGACSYFAPLKKFAITPGLVFDYDVYLTIGTEHDIRSRFYEIRERNLALR